MRGIVAETRAILCVMLAVVFLTAQDMLIKTLSGDYPLHEIVLYRACVALLVTLFIIKFEGGFHLLKTRRAPLHLARGIFVVLANSLFFMGVAGIPIGEATAIFFVAPVLMTGLSVVLLKERVGIRRWSAVAVGLAGCMLIMRPGADTFQLAALLPLGAAVAYASLQVATRALGATDSAASMAFYIQFTFILVSGGIGLAVGDGRFAGSHETSVSLQFLLRAWVWPAADDIVTMTGIGVLNAMGGYLLAQAYRLGRVASVAPFEYISLPLAIGWGFLIWGEVPGFISVIGFAMIAGGGMVVVLRGSRDRVAAPLRSRAEQTAPADMTRREEE